MEMTEEYMNLKVGEAAGLVYQRLEEGESV